MRILIWAGENILLVDPLVGLLSAMYLSAVMNVFKVFFSEC